MKIISQFNDVSFFNDDSFALHLHLIPLGTIGSAWQSNPTGDKWVAPAVTPYLLKAAITRLAFSFQEFSIS